MIDEEPGSKIVKETPLSETPGDKILHGCRDALSNALLCMGWKIIITVRNHRENLAIESENAIMKDYKDLKIDNDYRKGTIEYYNRLKRSKTDFKDAIKEIQNGITGELGLLRRSLFDNKKGENTTD